MFAAPPVLKAEVYATLPDKYRKRDQSAAWFEVQRRGLKTHSFIEGPALDSHGNLYFTDIPFGRIFRAGASGEVELVHEYDGEPNGLKVLDDHCLLIADHKHGIVQLDLNAGAISPYCDRPLLERFKGVNDLFVSPDGDLYFTDQGQSGLQDPTGRVYHRQLDGTLRCLMNNIPSPNGIVLDASGESVLVAVTRANQVWRLPLLRDGSVSKAGVLINLSGGVGPDGLALGPDGTLAVCHPGLASVWLFDLYGEPLLRIVAPRGRMTTNCVFGGPDDRTLFITESDTGTVLRAELPGL